MTNCQFQKIVQMYDKMRRFGYIRIKQIEMAGYAE